MNHLFAHVAQKFDLASLMGTVVLGVLFLVLATVVSWLIRRSARRFESRLSNVTAWRFASVFGQLMTYLIALVFYAQLVPELRAIGTALLAGAGVASIVVGLAARDTLGNLIDGFALVVSRTARVDDSIRLYTAVGTISARIRSISLGFTSLTDNDGNEVIVPNSVMMGSAIVRIRPQVPLPSAGSADGKPRV